MIANRTATTAPAPVRKAILRASASFRACSSSRSRGRWSAWSRAASSRARQVGHIKFGGDIGAAVERERFRKASALMRKP